MPLSAFRPGPFSSARGTRSPARGLAESSHTAAKGGNSGGTLPADADRRRAAAATAFPSNAVVVVAIGATPTSAQGPLQPISKYYNCCLGHSRKVTSRYRSWLAGADFIVVDTAGAGVITSIPLPTSATGSQLGCTLSQDQTAGLGTLSGDGSMGMVACYNAPVGAASPLPSSVSYVAARLLSNGQVDTSIYTNYSSMLQTVLPGTSYTITDVRTFAHRMFLRTFL